MFLSLHSKSPSPLVRTAFNPANIGFKFFHCKYRLSLSSAQSSSTGTSLVLRAFSKATNIRSKLFYSVEYRRPNLLRSILDSISSLCLWLCSYQYILEVNVLYSDLFFNAAKIESNNHIPNIIIVFLWIKVEVQASFNMPNIGSKLLISKILFVCDSINPFYRYKSFCTIFLYSDQFWIKILISKLVFVLIRLIHFIGTNILVTPYFLILPNSFPKLSFQIWYFFLSNPVT